MNDKRKPGRARGRNVIAEAPLLRIAWPVVIVIVDAGFADRCRLGMLGRADDVIDRDVELLVGVVRMRSDRAEDITVSLRDRDEIGVTLDAGRDRDHAPYPSPACAADDGVELAAEV